ncbi:hypothetical protein B0H19DRAFT_1084158 [Mycena capillaripes]|nr:hypothetical protein B0H19DRAFT_1084158 [Mycena capillaripes]
MIDHDPPGTHHDRSVKIGKQCDSSWKAAFPGSLFPSATATSLPTDWNRPSETESETIKATGCRLSRAGHREDALRVNAEAFGLLRMLPENPALTETLAMTLSNMGLDFSAVGRHEDAMRAEVEAVQLKRKLSKTDPAISTHLASSLHRLGVRLRAAERHEEALDAHEEAVRIRRRLSEKDSAVIGHQENTKLPHRP